MTLGGIFIFMCSHYTFFCMRRLMCKFIESNVILYVDLAISSKQKQN